jgi:hypothetical protein
LLLGGNPALIHKDGQFSAISVQPAEWAVAGQVDGITWSLTPGITPHRRR